MPYLSSLSSIIAGTFVFLVELLLYGCLSSLPPLAPSYPSLRYLPPPLLSYYYPLPLKLYCALLGSSSVITAGLSGLFSLSLARCSLCARLPLPTAPSTASGATFGGCFYTNIFFGLLFGSAAVLIALNHILGFGGPRCCSTGA